MNVKNWKSLELKYIFHLLPCQFLAYHIRCRYIKKPMHNAVVVFSLPGCLTDELCRLYNITWLAPSDGYVTCRVVITWLPPGVNYVNYRSHSEVNVTHCSTIVFLPPMLADSLDNSIHFIILRGFNYVLSIRNLSRYMRFCPFDTIVSFF